MPDISVVTCVSRPDVYDRCLLRSVSANRGRHDVEIIPVLNDGNHYSASNALNVGLDVSRSDLVVLAHQDVRLLPGWFDRLREVVAGLPPDWGVLGAAGISLAYGRADIGRWGGAVSTDTVAVGTVWDADEKLAEPPYWDGLKETTRVHCADECLLVMNRRTRLRFDSLFTGFHFYGVDLCLQARAAGYGVYCSDLPIIHYGSYSASFTGNNRYWPYLRTLHNKWRRRFPELLGTHMHWSRDPAELTSYINVAMDSGDGIRVGIKSMGVSRAVVSGDHERGFVDGD